MLFACHDSRTVALNQYQPLSCEQLPSGAEIQYFDPSIDLILHASPSRILRSQNTADFFFLLAGRIPELRRLAISEDTVHHPRDINGHRLAGFDHLEELILLHSDDLMEDIKKVSFMVTFESNSREGPTGFLWTCLVPELRGRFAEHEQGHVGWRAPRIRSGRFIRRLN
jgi:hypothetical protein